MLITVMNVLHMKIIHYKFLVMIVLVISNKMAILCCVMSQISMIVMIIVINVFIIPMMNIIVSTVQKVIY